MDEKSAAEKAHEKALPLIRLAEARMILPLSLTALSLVASDKYRDNTYQKAVKEYLEVLEKLWSRVGRWLATRVSRSPWTLTALASFRLGVQVRYRRGGREDYASLSTLLTNYTVSIEDGVLIVDEARRGRAAEEFVVYSSSRADKWEALYDSVLPARLAAGLGGLEDGLLASILAMLSDPVYVAEPTGLMEVLTAYGQAVEVRPLRGQTPLAYLVLL